MYVYIKYIYIHIYVCIHVCRNTCEYMTYTTQNMYGRRPFNLAQVCSVCVCVCVYTYMYIYIWYTRHRTCLVSALSIWRRYRDSRMLHTQTSSLYCRVSFYNKAVHLMPCDKREMGERCVWCEREVREDVRHVWEMWERRVYGERVVWERGVWCERDERERCERETWERCERCERWVCVAREWCERDVRERCEKGGREVGERWEREKWDICERCERDSERCVVWRKCGVGDVREMCGWGESGVSDVWREMWEMCVVRHVCDACCKCGMLHTSKSFVTHMNASCHTYEWVVSHMWMSHVTHMNESCHIYEWVRTRCAA